AERAARPRRTLAPGARPPPPRGPHVRGDRRRAHRARDDGQRNPLPRDVGPPLPTRRTPRDEERGMTTLPPDCVRVRDELRAYLDGEVSRDERATIESHVGSCPACRAELDAFVGVATRLDEAFSGRFAS